MDLHKTADSPSILSESKLTRKKMMCSCPYCQAVDAGGEEIKNSDGKRLHNCHHENCGQIFDTPLKLAVHLHGESHQNQNEPFLFKCEYPRCGKIFSQFRYLTRHMKVHTGISIHKASLTRHRNRKTHGIIQNSKTKIMCECPNCQVVADKKIVDTKGRLLHNCHHANCEKVFINPGNLLNHLNTHSEERSYSCRWQNDVLIQKKEKIHSCDLCGHRFSKKAYLAHQKRGTNCRSVDMKGEKIVDSKDKRLLSSTPDVNENKQKEVDIKSDEIQNSFVD